MTIAGRALPELLGRPRVFRSGVLQIHLSAASLATNTDIGVVHVEILVSRPSGSQHDSQAGHPVWSTPAAARPTRARAVARSDRSLGGRGLLLSGRVSD